MRILLALIVPLLLVGQAAPVYRMVPLTSLVDPFYDEFASLTGDFGPVTRAAIIAKAVAVDGTGGLYVADAGADTIRRIQSDGTVVPVMGAGHDWRPGLNGEALLVPGVDIEDVAVGPDGSVYVLETFGERIGQFLVPAFRVRKIAPDGLIDTLVSRLSAQGNVSSAKRGGIACDQIGNVYVAGGARYWRIQPDGAVTEFDSVAQATDVAIDATGRIFVTDRDKVHVFREDGSAIGEIGGAAGPGEDPHGGDGGPASAANTVEPIAVAVDGRDRLFILDAGKGRDQRVRMVDESGIIHTVAGGGIPNAADWGENGSYRRGFTPIEIAVEPSGVLYVVGNSIARGDGAILRIDDDLQVSSVNPCGNFGCHGDGGPSIWARLSSPTRLARDTSGNLYIADMQNQRIRKLAPDGTITTVAGSGQAGYDGDGIPAVNARLFMPYDVEVDQTGNIYIADAGDDRIRMVDTNGIIHTIAGNGKYGGHGNGIPATEASLTDPRGVAVSPNGDVYIAESIVSGLRKVSPDGIITDVSKPHNLIDVEVAADGTVYVATAESHEIAKVAPDGSLVVLARDVVRDIELDAAGEIYYCALSSMFDYPLTVNVDAVYRLDESGHRHTLPALYPGETEPRKMLGSAVLPAGNGDFFVLSENRLWLATTSQSPYPEPAPEIRSAGVRNAASFIHGAIAPGQLVSIFGERLGPQQGINAEAGPDGIIGSELAGTRVFFNDLPAPILYTQSGQVNAVVPFGIAGPSPVTVRVEYRGSASNTFPAPELAAAPGVFVSSVPVSTGTVRSAALNQDYTPNSSDAPARRGSVIMMWATGGGETDPPSEDGAIAGEILPKPKQPVTVLFDGMPVEVLYAGAAPGMVAGVMQINVRVPLEFPQSLLRRALVEVRGGNAPSIREALWVEDE